MSKKPEKRRARDQNAAASPQPGALLSGRRLLLILLAVGVAAGTWAFLEFVLWNKLPPELVGKWVVIDGPQEGATFDFYRKGVMVGRVNVRGKEGHVYAAIRLDGNTIHSTTRNESGKERTDILVIRTLTATELVLEDEHGKLLRMERAD